jgi:hypothetical protein
MSRVFVAALAGLISTITSSAQAYHRAARGTNGASGGADRALPGRGRRVALPARIAAAGDLGGLCHISPCR